MLLTQSQVSVALSAVIVVACTVALFLSGYVLQQKTVSNIRQAIKPPPRPEHTFIVLPTPSSPDEDSQQFLSQKHEDQIVEVIHNNPKGRQNDRGQDPSRWELKTQSNEKPIDKKTSIRIEDAQSIQAAQEEAMAVYNAVDLARQQDHEKLAAVVQDDSTPSTGKDAGGKKSSSKKGFMFPWTKKAKHGEDNWLNEVGDEVPWESLSRAARRKRIKNDIWNMGGREPVDASNVYRPRRRW